MSLVPVVVAAQTPAAVNARVEISAAVAGSSATLEAIERQAASRDRVRQREIAELQAQLIQAQSQGAAQVAQLQAELIAAREALVSDLSSRDRAFAEAIAVFRREVTDTASTPEGAVALARFNAGDRVGAIAALDRLRQVRDAARRPTQVDMERASEARQIATLALDARGKSDPAFDTGAVIARYEEVVRLDPSAYGDWYQLVQLYRSAGRSADARAAAERLEALAADDWGRATALNFTADILLSQGDRSGAVERFQRGLEIRERLSAAEPASADRARDMGVSLDRIGNVLLSQGDKVGARAAYDRSLEIRERLLAADPASSVLAWEVSVSLERIGNLLLIQGDAEGALVRFQRGLAILEGLSVAFPDSAELARDVGVALDRIGDVLLGQGRHDEALAIYQRSFDIRGRLASADPASADFAGDISTSLTKIGDVSVAQGDRGAALALYRRGLQIREELLAADRASADRERELSISLVKIGDVLLSQGDRRGALALFQRRLEIAERLSTADPASAIFARDVFVSSWRMAQVTNERHYWETALAILRDLEARRALEDSDRAYVAQLENRLAGARAR